MWYDGSNPLHAEQSRAQLEKLLHDKEVFELTKKSRRRSNNQNKYLHVILAYFGCETGNTMKWVKEKYYKELVNPDIFIIKKQDKYLGETKELRSSSDLDVEEMTTSITRFRNWASAECGIYLPSADEERLLQLMEIEVNRNKEFI